VIQVRYFLKVTRTGALARAHAGLFLVRALAMHRRAEAKVAVVAVVVAQEMRRDPKRLVVHVGQ
jgi:hypothetical protein